MNSHPVWGVGKGQKEKIGHDHIGKDFSSMALKPINIRWNRTGSQPY